MFRAIFILAVLFMPSGLYASTGGILVVTVKEKDRESGKPGDVLPGITVLLSTSSVLGPGSYGLRTVVTGNDGRAVFLNLPPDDYWFGVEQAGFETRQWKVDVPSKVTRRVSVAIGLPIIECELGKFWDFRGSLDPGIGPKKTIIRRRKSVE